MNQAFWSHWGWALGTALLTTIFALQVARQYRQRRRKHQLYWSIGLALYAIAAYMEAYSEFSGRWEPFVYRFYIVFAAALVGFLGLGTLCLMTNRPLYGQIGLAYVLGISGLFLAGTLTATLDTAKLLPGVTVGGSALGDARAFPRMCSLFLNIPGGAALLGGAVISIFRFARKKEWAYRLKANVLIALGTLVIGWAGARARMGSTAGLYPAEMAGSALLFAGFLLAGTLNKGQIPKNNPNLPASDKANSA